MQLVDLAIQNGVDLDGSPIKKTLDLDTELWMLRIKDKVAVLKTMRNRCVKTGSKHFIKKH